MNRPTTIKPKQKPMLRPSALKVFPACPKPFNWHRPTKPKPMPRPTTLARPTDLETDGPEFTEVMLKAHKGMHDAVQMVYLVDGHYDVMPKAEWMKSRPGRAICQVRKLENGMRVGSPKIF